MRLHRNQDCWGPAADTVVEFKLSLDDIYEATFLLRNFGQAPQARLGRDLLRACDRLGHEEATLQVVSARLRQDIAQPGVLRATEVLRSLDRLRKLSENGNMRAVFLEGKLAARKGNEELAIKLYEQAMDMILVEEEEAKNNPAEKKQKQKWDRRLDDELSSPWIELGFLYMSRKRTTKALEAYMVGLSQDDPMAYYNLSVLDWHMADGAPSLEWLYNVTKAAASGHFKAAYELGRYYADSTPHPPPEDELLELSPSTKTNETEAPTTGETQPPTPKPAPTFLARLKHFLTTSLFKPSVTIDAKSNIAHYASFAQDAPSRILLAKEWLSLALSYNYLPAAIPLAKLHLQPYIWTSHNSTNDINWLSEASLATPGVAKNPLYDVKLAAQTLTAVFGAARTIENARFNAQTSAEFLELAKPWADFGEVLESYEGQVGEVLEEAKEIADAVGVDVMHPDYGLMYKHRGKRGEGVSEYKE